MSGPLAGIRVVELAGLGPAPFGAMLLADLGADVVRVDRPDTAEETTPRHAVTERGKRSIALDLKDPQGQTLARRLIDSAAVLIDPFRPGVAERLGLAPAACLASNPGLVYARMTGWGQDGPLAQSAAHDLNYVALAGALHPIGPATGAPAHPLNLLGDYGGGGMLLAFGVVAALFERERSGAGQVLDIAMLDGAATLMAAICGLDAAGEWSHRRGTNWLDGAAHWYGSYRTADGGFVTIGALEPQFYAELLRRLELEHDAWPQWERERWPELRTRMADLFATQPLAHWTERLEGSDACFAPVLRFDEAADHPHVAHRGTYVRHEGVLQPAPAPRFGRTPGAVRRPPPRRDEHRDEILRELGAAAIETATTGVR
jgi:alpha-methylacyl-CoA racemase